MKKIASANRRSSPKRNGVARAIGFALKQAETGTTVAEVCRNRTAEADGDQ